MRWIFLTCLCSAAAIITPLPGYNVSWVVNGSDVQFTLQVATTGWIGMGISGGAGMKGADIVRIDGSGNIEDGYAMGKEAPKVDCQQDWILISRSVVGGSTTAVIQRRLDTGDAQDRPLVDEQLGTLLIFAHGLPGETNFMYHGTLRRATMKISLEGQLPSLDALKNDPDVKTFTVQAMNYTVPYPGNMDEFTSYVNFCGNIPEESHVVAWEPVIQIDAEHHSAVHHMAIYASTIPCEAGKTDGRGHKSIEETSPYASYFLYAPGIAPYLLPPDIGLPVGGKVKAFIINQHYDNPAKKRDLIDNSGIKVYYTTKKRKYDMGVLFMGDPGLGFNQQPVRLADSPDQALAEYTFSCPASYFTETNSTGQVKILGSFLHMHFSGEYMKTELVDYMGKRKASWEIDVYDGSFQSMLKIHDVPIVEAGDSFRTICAFNANLKAHGKDRKWGFGADDEMCMDWVFFYSEDNDVVKRIDNHYESKCGYGATPGSIAVTKSHPGLFDLTHFGKPPVGKNQACNNVTIETQSLHYEQLHVNGSIINLASMGPRNASTLVLCLHGFPHTAAMYFDEFAPELIKQLGAGTTVRVIAPDLRGVNHTMPKYPCASLQCENYSPKTITDEVASLLKQHFSAKPMHVVAHDFGGVVAFRLAIFYPELVLTLTCADMSHPSVFRHFLIHDDLQKQASAYAQQLKESDVAYEGMKPNPSQPSPFVELLALLRDGMDYSLNQAWLYNQSLKHHLYWYRGSDAFATVDEGVTHENIVLQMPVLMIWGMEDQYVLSRQLCCMKNVAANLTFLTFENVDHWVFEQKPIEIAKAVASHIAGNASVQDRCKAVHNLCTIEREAVCTATPALPPSGCNTSNYPEEPKVSICSICDSDNLVASREGGKGQTGQAYSCGDAQAYLNREGADGVGGCVGAKSIWSHCCGSEKNPSQCNPDKYVSFATRQTAERDCTGAGAMLACEDECKRAAERLGKDFKGTYLLEDGQPIGCMEYHSSIQSQYSGIYFNTNREGGQLADHYPICGEMYTTSTTTVAFTSAATTPTVTATATMTYNTTSTTSEVRDAAASDSRNTCELSYVVALGLLFLYSKFEPLAR